MPQASSRTDFRNTLSGSSKLTDTRFTEEMEDTRSELGMGSGGLSEGQLSTTAILSPEANTKSEISSAFASACSLKGRSAPPLRLRQYKSQRAAW